MKETDRLFDEYERRFAKAAAQIPLRDPLRDRAEILEKVKSCLGFKDAWIPSIKAEPVQRLQMQYYDVELLKGHSWDRISICANLYLPHNRTSPLPLVLLCCGHGLEGKLTPIYQDAAQVLAERGAAVLVPDNIGQGERKPMGHLEPVMPFANGHSVQALIVMETIAWLKWLLKDSRFDPARIAAAGNSGGGTLTMFLAALAPELSAIASSGYPCSFDYIARKEKKHCHCNIIPGIVGELEMWQLYGAYAPKPLLLFQAAGDCLFPMDSFYSNARKVEAVYEMSGAKKNFQAVVTPGEHPWDHQRIELLAKFMTSQLRLAATPATQNTQLNRLTQTCFEHWPDEARTTDELSCLLSGSDPKPELGLWDVFPPPISKRELLALPDPGERGTAAQIFAQYEAFLKH